MFGQCRQESHRSGQSVRRSCAYSFFLVCVACCTRSPGHVCCGMSWVTTPSPCCRDQAAFSSGPPESRGGPRRKRATRSGPDLFPDGHVSRSCRDYTRPEASGRTAQGWWTARRRFYTMSNPKLIVSLFPTVRGFHTVIARMSVSAVIVFENVI